jgi:ectoine hydroxylase-related dioxygenase (phytanoyl-CoA dioxygenase family)
MAKAMMSVSELGLPPIFVFIYDEFWQVFYRLSPLLSPIFGDNYRMIANQWAWNFPASHDSSGFAPHRDGEAVDFDWFPNKIPLRENGLPLLATIWIPLTDVTPLNSCMYLLPLDRDPRAYGNLDDVTIHQESIQDIRALPCKAGSILSWNPYVLHWGSNGSAYAREARMSIATYLLSDGLKKTHKSFSLARAQPLALGYRLRLIGQNMDQYGGHLMNCPPDLTGFCHLYAKCWPHDINFQVSV